MREVTNHYMVVGGRWTTRCGRFMGRVLGAGLLLTFACGGSGTQVRAPSSAAAPRAASTETKVAASEGRGRMAFRELVAAKLDIFPCQGLEALGPEAVAEAWTILGDPRQVEDWADVVQSLSLVGTGEDLAKLIAFARTTFMAEVATIRSYSGPRFAALCEIVWSIAIIGGRMQEQGDKASGEHAQECLIEWSEPQYWNRLISEAGTTSHLLSSEVGKYLADASIVSLGYFTGDEAAGRTEAKKTKMVAAGAWTPRMEGKYQNSFKIQRAIEQCGGFRGYIESNFHRCPGF